GTPDDDTCTTTVCHSASNTAVWGDTTQAWGGGSSIGCDECHYWAAAPDAGNNGATAGTISELSHDGHFAAAGRSFVCADCHATVTDASHITSPAGTNDGAVLVGRANAEQDEAAIDTSGSWFATGSWTDGTDTCANVCHDPSVDGGYSAAWGSTNSSCAFCHSMTDPGTGSHGAHMAAAGTYGIPVNCDSCHPNNGTAYGHMTGSVALSLSNLTYSAGTAAPYNTTFGACSTTTCHNDGQGSAVATSTWGTAIADPNCGICHDSAPSTLSHNAHFGAAATWGVSPDCDSCHASGGQDQSMGAWSSHIDSAVTMASGAASYDGGVVVGDTNYGSCLTNVCHNDGTAAVGIPARAYTWGVSLADDCASCHEG
ncbi:MAG: CxxxxCH/CxxCH domain-containing protein, partial [Desulfuromonadales bacterium]|nr:CxxxxCH/CxxCH domain-containing protein [Desulfuromonadales bacterium]